MAEGGIPGIGEIMPIRVEVMDVASSSPADHRLADKLSRTMDAAMDKALRVPAGPTDPALRANSFLADNQPSKMVSGSADLDGKAGERDAVDIAMDRITDRLRTVNMELTSFKVAWGLAKRAGRDIETLLKAQ